MPDSFQAGEFSERPALSRTGGALNKLLSLSPEEREKGSSRPPPAIMPRPSPTTASAWGSGPRSSCPMGTPLIKVVSTQSYGAEVILHGETVDDARNWPSKIARRRRLDPRPPLRGPLDHRRAGHDRPRRSWATTSAPGRDAGPLPDRRRRPHLRGRRLPEGEPTRRSGSSGWRRLPAPP